MRKQSARWKRKPPSVPGSTFTRMIFAEASLRDRGLRDFRETVAEAEGLGGAAAEARRAAHATYDAMPEASPRNFDHHNAASRARVSEPRFSEEIFQESYAPSTRVRPLMTMKNSTRGPRALTAASSNWPSFSQFWRERAALPIGSDTPSPRWWRASVRSRRRNRKMPRSPQPVRRLRTASDNPRPLRTQRMRRLLQ